MGPLVDYDSGSGSSEEGGDKQIRGQPSQQSGGLLNAAPKTVMLSNDKSLASRGTAPYTHDEPVGPANPFENSQKGSLKRKNMITGHAEEQAFNDATFRIQHRTYQMLGYAQNPSMDGNGELIGDLEKAESMRGQVISEIRPTKEMKQNVRSKRERKGDPTVLDGKDAYKGPWAEYKDDEDSSSAAEYSEEEQDTMGPKLLAAATTAGDSESEPEDEEPSESTEFHGKSVVDYLGRTYMHVPQDLDIDLRKPAGDIEEWFLPKRKVHSWLGHSKGVSKLEFFPQFGHLLLSGGNDHKVKIWDAFHDRELLRSYMGHSKPIKDINFNPDGTQFLSASYDKMVKLWDTETGKCLSKFTNGSVPNCIKFNPAEPNSFIVGTANNKIIQYDSRDPKNVVQEYTHHLGAINSLTFVDSNYRFMSTSDDKSIRVWDWGINVPIKFIADPAQYSMPSVSMHPSQKYVAAQSMDNRILVFGAKDRFRQNKKKEFTGYNNAGYSIGIGFSPDGKYIITGESNGNLVFWDWKKGGNSLKKIKAHNSPIFTVAVHPHETSKVASAGLDGAINYWD